MGLITRKRRLSVAASILFFLTTGAEAHTGHLELKNFWIASQGDKTFVLGQISYPEKDGRLSLKAVSSEYAVATLEWERNGKWAKVNALPIEGDLELSESSEYRLQLPPSFNFEVLQGKMIPLTLLFEKGGIQMVSARVGMAFWWASPWFWMLVLGVLILASSLALRMRLKLKKVNSWSRSSKTKR